MGKKKESKRKGKKERNGKKHSSTERKMYYTVEGSVLKRTAKFCSRCSSGTVLAKHSNRLYCGKCGYTEFQKEA